LCSGNLIVVGLVDLEGNRVSARSRSQDLEVANRQ
jgi:hypothetical protein